MSKIKCITIGWLLASFTHAWAGFGSSNLSAYWPNAELIVIGYGEFVREAPTESNPYGELYKITVEESIRGPKESEILVLRPSAGTSNNRWNIHSEAGKPSVFVGSWDEDRQLWNVPYASEAREGIIEAVRAMHTVDSAKNDIDRAERVKAGLLLRNVDAVYYLRSEAKRLGRLDLLEEYYRWQLEENPHNIYAAEALLKLGDRSMVPLMKSWVADPEFTSDSTLTPRADVLRVLVQDRSEDWTDYVKLYIDDSDEFVRVAVLSYLFVERAEIDYWRALFALAQSTDNPTIRRNACYYLEYGGHRLSITELEEIQAFVKEHEVSFAIQNGLRITIERKQKKRDSH